MKKTNNNIGLIHLFTYNNRDLIYSFEANALFEPSKKAISVLKNIQTSIEIDNELIDFKRKQTSLSLPIKILYISAVKNLELDCESYFEYLNERTEYLKKQIILELNHGNQVVEKIISFNNYLKSKGYELIIKENIRNIYSQNNIDILLKHNINIFYYANIDSLNELIQSTNRDMSAVIEIKLVHIDDFLRLKSFAIPSKIRLLFNTTNIETSKQIFEFLNKKIKSVVKNKESVYRLGNLIRLLKFNLGKQLPELDIFYYSINESIVSSDEKKCNGCWAKKICWGTGTYNIFSSHPSLTNNFDENCNLIQTLIENVFKAYLEIKDNNSQSNIPIIIKKNGFILKIINP